ncbi:MAG: aldehyde dehydrogenase family protein, partial [Legionellales bacterium]|nr:aldehyde dehydrogenase family protein [Legionellales bacterium]
MKDILLGNNLVENNSGIMFGDCNFDLSNSKIITSINPANKQEIAKVSTCNIEHYNLLIQESKKAFLTWRDIPSPKRGEIIRQIGNALRKNKENLGKLVTLETGKSLQEGLGEIQEAIDIADLAVGQSRMLYGFTMHSERKHHRMYEQWHPYGTIGIISAFNFPVAVWCWNTALAWVCGDVCIWKPSEKTPLTAVACQNIAAEVFAENDVPEGVCGLVIGDAEIGKLMTSDKRIPLISATGSTRMGKLVGETVAKRLGRSLLELGGNNAVIITPSADLKMVIPGVVFGAIGTGGQRCTSTRRLIIHESVYENVKEVLVNAYKQVKIGNPLDESFHMGPLIDKGTVEVYLEAIKSVKAEGGSVLVEGEVLTGEGYESG